MTVTETAFIVIGQFGAAFGVSGWLKVNSFTEPSSNILSYQPWFIGEKDSWQPIEVEASEVQHNKIRVKLAVCDTVEAAKRYTHLYIAMPRQQLPHLEKGQFYWSDLIGMTVINEEQVNLGVVDSLLATGANDVVVVRDNKKERLVPFIDSAIKNIDEKTRIITVDWDADF